LPSQLVGKVFIMAAQELGVGGVVESCHDSVLRDPNITLQSIEEIARQMGRIPTGERRTEALAQLMDSRLSQQCHCQLAVTDI